jgi:hypothetical protein
MVGRTLAAMVGIPMALVASFAEHATAQTKLLRDQLLGTWILSSNIVVGKDGSRTEQFGASPKGILIFAPDGRFATVNARADLPTIASGKRTQTTPEENQAVVAGSLAYYGTYRVSETEKMITVQIEGSTFANQVGTVQTRLITLITKKEMRFTNLAATSGGSLELVWRRADKAAMQ